MKKTILYIAALSMLAFTSCDETKMDWHRDPSYGEVKTSELPLQLAEKITRYQPLLAYLPNPNAKLGIGVGLDLYMNNPVYDSIIHQNFNDIALGYAMKHGPMVNGKGECVFTAIDPFLEKAAANNMSVFGHCLIWHTNQNAGYLNNLIADVIIPDAGNLLDLGVLLDGSFAGWTMNGAQNISLEKGSGYGGGDAIKLVASGTSNYWDLQMTTPELVVNTAHRHEISFWVRSETEGSARLSFNGGIANRWPWKDWYNTGGSWTEAFATNSGWQKVQIYLEASDFTDKTFQICFDFGAVDGVTYFIDINNMLVKDLEAEPANMIPNGDFENGTIDGWGGWGNNSTREISAEGEGYGDKGYCMVMVNPSDADAWSAQTLYQFDEFFDASKTYYISWRAKCLSGAGKIQVELQNASYSANYSGTRDVGTDWQMYEWEVIPDQGEQNKFIFDFGAVGDTYYIDDVKMYIKEDAASAPKRSIIIPKTDEEKREIIAGAMESWISQMVGHCSPTVHAWDVVNEPMDDGKPSGLKSGIGKELASDEFYWQDYLGKDYAVMAFKLARQYGNPDDVLFINDYNLEYNLAKCDGLIEYVKYIESQGAVVDGIGTQLHVSIDYTDTLQIAEMYKKLAATGKKIKVSELDVKVGTTSPTSDQLARQANMYRFIVENYFKLIPEAQQYGITIWSVSDNVLEHEFWIPDDCPNLWNADYRRKHAYKGVCDGLAGYDVSKDFTGDLQ